MSSSRTSPLSPQPSVASWSALPSPATATEAPSSISEPHAIYPVQTGAAAAPQAVPVCSRFAALRSSAIFPASSTPHSIANSAPVTSVPALLGGASLLDRLKPFPTSPDGRKAAATSAVGTPASGRACAAQSSKTQHTRIHPSADANSVKRSTGGCVSATSSAALSLSTASASPTRQSASLTTTAASPGNLYRPPHVREDSTHQHGSTGDGGGADHTETAMSSGTTVSGATPTPSAISASVAGEAAVTTASFSSSPPPLRPSVSAVASESLDASSRFPVSEGKALPSPTRQDGGGSVSAAPSSAESAPALAAAVGSGTSFVTAPPPPTACEEDQHGRAGDFPAVNSSVKATPGEHDSAEGQEAEPPPKTSRSAKRKQKIRAAAAAAAAAAAEAEMKGQHDPEVRVDVATERSEVVASHPKGSSAAETTGTTSSRIGFGAHSSSSRTGSTPTKTAVAPNTSSVSRRRGWHPSLTTPMVTSTAVAGGGVVDVAGSTEVVSNNWKGGVPISFAEASLSTSHAGQILSTMPCMSNGAGQLLPTEMVKAGGGGGNIGDMNGYGYQQQQYYVPSLLSQQQQQQQQIVMCGHYNGSPMATPQQPQQRSNAQSSTSGVDLSSAAASTSPNSSSTHVKALQPAGAANTSMQGAAATMLGTANIAMSATGGGAVPPPHRAPGLYRGRGAAAAAAAAASQSIAVQLLQSAAPSSVSAATGRASPSALLPLQSGHLAGIRVGVSTTMNADPSATPSVAATDVTSNATATGVGYTSSPMLNMASGMAHHHHHHPTPSLVHPSSIPGQFPQRPHQHHHQTISLGSLSLDDAGSGRMSTTHHEDIESQFSMSPGAAQEHISVATSPHMSSCSQDGSSAAMSRGNVCGTNHGSAANAKHKGGASDCAHSRGNNRRSGSRHSHAQQKAMLRSQPVNYINSSYGNMMSLNQPGAGHTGSTGMGMMPMHRNALSVGGGGAGQQPMFSHQPPPQQQHTMARPPPIPYYDFITVLPTFVATCLTLKPEDEANREQLCWIIEAVLRKHLNHNAEIRVHGSITTGLALSSSDVDLLAVGYQPIPPLEALQQLSNALVALDEDSKNEALRLQELIEAEAQHRRRHLMEESKERAKHVALAAAAATVTATPDGDRHRSTESYSSAIEVGEAASWRDSDSNADDTGSGSEENNRENEGVSGLSPKRVVRAGSITKGLLGSTAVAEMPGVDTVDESARAALNYWEPGPSQRSSCALQDGTATSVLQRSFSSPSLSTDSSTASFSSTAFPLDTRKVFLTASATVGDDDELVRLGSGSRPVPGAGAMSTCTTSGVDHVDGACASRLHDPDVAVAEDTEVYGTVGDVEQAEEVFRGQIEKDYSFSTSVDLSTLFAPAIGGGRPPVAPPAAATSSLGVGGVRSSGGGLARQTTTARMCGPTASPPSYDSSAASGCAEPKDGARSPPPSMTPDVHISEDNIVAHAQALPRDKAADADAEKLAHAVQHPNEQVMRADGGAVELDGCAASGGGNAAETEEEAAHAGTGTVTADEAAAAQPPSVSPTLAASGEKAAAVQAPAAPPATQGTVTQNPIVPGATGGRGHDAGHLTYVPVHEGPLFLVQAITATRVPVIKLTEKATGTKVDITFAGGEHWRSMQLTRSLLEVFPHARPLILFLKYCVRSLGAGENSPGGVTSFSIYLMVLHFYNECRKRIVVLLRERNAVSSSAKVQGRETGTGAGAKQHQQKERAAEEVLHRGGIADNSAATPHLAAAYQRASPTTGSAPLTLGLLEYMLGEYLVRVEQRHAQIVEEAEARRSASLDAAGAGDVAELYSSSGSTQKAVSPLRRASSSAAVVAGACATIKAAYASNDKAHLHAIRRAILGFVGDPATVTTAAATSTAATVAPAPQPMTGEIPAEDGGTGRTPQPQASSSESAGGASGGAVATSASNSISANTSSPMRSQQSPGLTGTVDLGSASVTPSTGEGQAPAVDAAPGRLAPPPHHYLLKTVEPQPHERVESEGSHVDAPGADEAVGRGEKVEEDTSAARSAAASEAFSQETRADAAVAGVAEGTETPKELVVAATGRVKKGNPEKDGQDSTQSASLSAETETASVATASADGKGDLANSQDAAGTHSSRIAEAAAAAAAAAASTSTGASEQHDDADEDSAFDAFAEDFLRRQVKVSDLFLDFCHYYGCAFDYEASGIRFTADGRSDVVAKPLLCSRRGQHFHMTSPFDPEYDLTARMTHMRDFQWLCWWFAEWGAARQSPQYYGSCSLQYVLQCLSPMSADADCQAVHQALMQQAVAAAPSAEISAATALAQNYRNGGTADVGGHPHHCMSTQIPTFQESMRNTHHMMFVQQQQQQQQQQQSVPRQPHTMMMLMNGNATVYGSEQQQQQSMGGSNTAAMMPMTLHAPAQQLQQLADMPMPPMNVYGGTRVEQRRGGGAGVAQHYAASPLPHVQNMVISSNASGHTYQQRQQQTSPGEANAVGPATYHGGGIFGEQDHSVAPHSTHGSSIGIASTAAKASATIQELKAMRAASSGSRSHPGSESGANAAARNRARRRPPLQLSYVDSREEGFEGSSSHATTTPTAAGMVAVHSYPDEDDDDVDSGGMAAVAVAASTSVNPLSSLLYEESPEGTWTSRTATTTTTTYGGSSPLERVDATLTPVRGDEDDDGETDEREYCSENAVGHSSHVGQYGGRGGASTVVPQHCQQQMAPCDAQPTAKGDVGAGEHGADELCDGYTPNMAYAGILGYTVSQQQQQQQQQVSYGSPQQMNQAAGVYLHQQQQQYRQQQEHAAAAAAFYYQAFAQQQQRQQQYEAAGTGVAAASAGYYGQQLQQPILHCTGGHFVATPGSSSPSSSHPFPALYYGLQKHLCQQQQQQQQPQQQYYTTQNNNGLVDVTLIAPSDQDGGSSHRSDGTSSPTGTSASAPQQQQQQQQQQAFPYIASVGYPSVVFGVGGKHQPNMARTAARGAELPPQPPDTIAMPSMTTYQNPTAAVVTGSPVNSNSNGGVEVNVSDPPPQQKQQQSPSARGGHRRPASHHQSGSRDDGSYAASQ